MAELLDAFDEWGNALGPVTREEVHRRGLWHHCFHLWVVRPGEALLQRRSRDRGSFAGMLDATAAGHLTAGEMPLDGLREAEEELGVLYTAEQVVPLGVRRSIDRFGDGKVNREHQHVFLVADPRPLAAFDALQAEEVDGLVALRLEHFLALACRPEVAGPWPGTEWDGAAEREVRVRREEVVPQVYLAPLAIMAERLLEGRGPLAV